MDGFGVQEAKVSARRIEGCYREQECGEGVEVEGFEYVTLEQRGESTGGAAAGAVEVEVLVDGTLRIELVLRGWTEKQ